MGINSAMQAGITGLAANSSALSSYSNNIANVNTTAYKRVLTDFKDIVTGSSTNTSFNSGGVLATTRQTISQSGQLQATTSGLDLGVDGQGFFVVSDTAAPKTSTGNDTTLFTRDGSFSTDKKGYLVNASGLYLQGWPVAADGSVTTDSSDVSKLGPINISNIGGTAEATTQVAINANLLSSQAVSTGVAAYDPTSPTLAMSTYDPTTSPVNGTKPDFDVSIPVSDSKGGQQTLTMSLLKTGANTWSYEIYSPDIADASGKTIATGGLGQVTTGTLAFTTDGVFDPTNSTPQTGTPATFDPTLAIGASSSTSGPHWDSALGVSGQNVTLALGGGSASGLTQFDSDSVTQSVTSNGTAFGNLSKISIDKYGMVTASFDNGVTRNIAQVAVATFINANGLVPVSGNAYTVSTDSGTFSLKVPGVGGSGLLSPGTLEASSVDLSQEFTGLITTQRAYSAASKIITTADQMLQELLSIKQ